MVVNDEMSGGATGVPGWTSASRVLVAEEDAVKARRIAVEFDRRGAETTSEPHSHESSAEPGRQINWPTCPQCGESRRTRCPICHTSGSDFEPVDMGFEWIPDLGKQGPAKSTGCGPGGCGSNDCHSASADNEASDMPEDQLDDESREDWSKNMLICHTCDEPFAVEYSRACISCGHEFGDGIEIEPAGAPADQVGHRAALTVVALLAIIAALAAYFALVLY